MEHIFWLEHHPRSIIGLIEYFVEKKDKVICICYDDGMFKNRVNMGWLNENIPGADFIYLNKLDDVDSYFYDFCKYHPYAINYIMGVRASKISKYVNKYLIPQNDARIFMIAERPYLYGKGFLSKKILNLFYLYLGYKYRLKINGVLAMGTLGVIAYRTWANGNVFPFLYPKFNDVIVESKEKKSSVEIRALYVGQLDKRKGVDVMLDAFETLPKNIHLDIVGDNGDIKENIKTRISKMSNVSYLGVWNSNDVATKSAAYDVCIVPSRYDGWGMYVMEALEAGIGVITTDLTGSKDLVISSGAGLIVKAGDSNSLRKALESLLDNPKIVSEWKKLAIKYKGKISKESVGDYVRQIVSAPNGESMRLVKCPWL